MMTLSCGQSLHGSTTIATKGVHGQIKPVTDIINSSTGFSACGGGRRYRELKCGHRLCIMN